MPATEVFLLAFAAQGFDSARIPLVNVDNTVPDIAIIDVRFPCKMVITGLVTAGTGGSALNALTISRAAYPGGTFVPIATGAAIAPAGTTLLLPAILGATANAYTSAVGANFQIVLDCSAGGAYKIAAGTVSASTVQLTLEVSVAAFRKD